MALRAVALSLITYNTNAQVGIGTTLPEAKLHVHDGSALFTNVQPDPSENPFYKPGTPKPIQYHSKWFHTKGAFRVLGEETTNQGFDLAKIGKFSFGSGFEVTASGLGAMAIGLRTEATAVASVAFGWYAKSAADVSLAFGTFAEATGSRSTAIGSNVSTNSKRGSMIFGDMDGFAIKSDAINQVMMRFQGGYKFFSNSKADIGVDLPAGGNSWATISDVNKKENFAPVNGEDFLQKISKMNLTSWNYKGQDPKAFRHYGPMAQDFFKAFGRDGYGTIGSDTTISQADFDGVNLIAIQALVKRTEELNDRLMSEIMALRKELELTSKAVQRKKARVASK